MPHDDQPAATDAAQRIAIAVVEHAGQFLIGRRADDVPLAGLWEFPGGKIRDAETADEAARRECREETDLEVRVVGRYPRVVHRYPHGLVELEFCACQLADPAQQPRPPFRWVPAARLASYAFPEANRALVRELSAGARGAG